VAILFLLVHRVRASSLVRSLFYFLPPSAPIELYHLTRDLNEDPAHPSLLQSHAARTTNKTGTPECPLQPPRADPSKNLFLPNRHSLFTQGACSTTERSRPPAQLAGSLPVSRPSRKVLRALPTYLFHTVTIPGIKHICIQNRCPSQRHLIPLSTALAERYLKMYRSTFPVS
jgi:hypothetical protein